MYEDMLYTVLGSDGALTAEEYVKCSIVKR
jgi:hypothetical protein